MRVYSDAEGVFIPEDLRETISTWRGQIFYVHINQSRYRQYDFCKRKYYWQYEEQLDPGTPAYYLDVGGAVHKGLELLAEGKPKQEAIDKALVYFDEKVSVYKAWADEQPKIDEQRALTQRLLNDYMAYYGDDMDGEAWKVIHPEVTGAVAVGLWESEGVLYVAVLVFRTDAIISWRGKLWLLEHKTMGSNHPMNWMRYYMDIQVTAYIWACSQLLGIRVAGALLNGLIKTKVPQFNRALYTRTDAQLNEFRDEFTDGVREMFERTVRCEDGEDPLIVWRKNTQACFQYGACKYRGLCDSFGKARTGFSKRAPDYVDDKKLLTAPKEQEPGDEA